jgi:hypothetical protein
MQSPGTSPGWEAMLQVAHEGGSRAADHGGADQNRHAAAAAPLTAAVLGAGYWASFALELLSARERHWARTRVAVPAVLLFSTLRRISLNS